MKTTFTSALALMINEARQAHGLQPVEISAPGGLSDAEVLRQLVERIASSDMDPGERDDLLAKLQYVASLFPSGLPAGEA